MDQAAGTGDDKKLKNTIPIYGNKETMNLNTMILTNIQSSPYFKEDLYQYKTFHEVVDEIYYRVRILGLHTCMHVYVKIILNLSNSGGAPGTLGEEQ